MGRGERHPLAKVQAHAPDVRGASGRRGAAAVAACAGRADGAKGRWWVDGAALGQLLWPLGGGAGAACAGRRGGHCEERRLQDSLHIASEKGHLEVVRELLARGAAVDTAENDGATPLFIASEKGRLKVLRELLARGAAVDTARNDGVTPLYIASRDGHVEVVRELLARGAAVNAARNDGWTSLLSACLNNHLEVVRELLAHGASPSLAAGNVTALFICRDNPAILQVGIFYDHSICNRKRCK